MDITNQAVEHCTFGKGTVISQNDTVITVGFLNTQQKLFEYPEAFQTHLVLCEPSLQQAVCAEVKRKTQMLSREKLRQKMHQSALLSRQKTDAKK